MNPKKYLPVLYHFLKKHKRKWLVFILLSCAFFLIRFPYEEAISYLIGQLRKNTKSPIQFQYDRFYIHPLGPSIVFKNPEILTPTTLTPFKATELRFRPSYKSLLQLKPGGILILKWPDSLLNVTVGKQQMDKDIEGWFINIKAQNFNPSFLSPFLPILSKTKGKVNFNINMLLDPRFQIQPSGNWSITGYNIQSQALSYTFPGAIGTISLPAFQWSQIRSEGEMKKGDALISDASLGEKKDSFQIKTRGVMSFKLMKQGFSNKIIPRLKSYNIGLEILASEDLKPKLYFLDILFSSVASETPQGWHYLAQVKGNAANFFDLSPVKQLPTLQEIQNPLEGDIYE
ncbi:MAG: hypothetical protein OXM55_00810 [Bdellovibrionales bacterium]|nr:hypothetical protein [Bdellovibrionales bacterium]